MESEATFRQRALAVGIPEGDLQMLGDKGVNTFSTFAFCAPMQNPQSIDERPLLEALTELLELSEQISGPRVIPYRRLYFESQTLALSDMKQRLERRDDQAPRKMCLPERVQRLKLARDELTGITIDAAFEPSHRLTDICLQQCEDQSISYIELHDCTSREWEISNRKRDSAIEFQVDGTLRMTKKEQRVHHEPTGEHKIRTAMLRRALAYHLVGAASYQVLERAITKLFSYLSREPVRGFRAVSLQQIVFAEKQMWIEASLATVGKVLDTAAPKPLNEAIIAAMDSPEVKQFLMFLPLAPETATSGSSAKREAPKADSGPAAKRPKGKGKGGGKNKGPAIPAGCVAVLSNGDRVCFAYQRCRCVKQKEAECQKGKHLCWREGCHGRHPGSECSKN